MKQKLSWILEGFFLIVILGFSILIYAPKQSESILHIRLIQVTDRNKEKAIEQDSLIIVKTFKGDEQPKDNTLISFRADRFGESVILTHMFVKSEVRNQETFYITQAPESSYYDTYETRHEDLIGTYLFHMKYMGRVYEFLQSGYGKITYVVIAAVCILSTLYMLFSMMRRDHKQKKAGDRTDEEPSIETVQDTTVPKEAEPIVSELSEDGAAIDIQVNQLEQKILEKIKEGNTKEDKIPQYRIAGIQEALQAGDKDVAEHTSPIEKPDSMPLKAQHHAGSEGTIKELDKLLKEEIEYEKYVQRVRDSEEDEMSERGGEEFALYIPTDQDILKHTYSEKDMPSFTDSQLQDASIDADIEEDSFVEADVSDIYEEQPVKQLKESKGNVQEHPVFDTPKHIVPQVVVYPQDTPEDVKGLYNSDASKFEKKIPDVEQLYIQAIGILEPMKNSIRDADNEVHKPSAWSEESTMEEPSAGFEITNEKAESEPELTHRKAKHSAEASAVDSVLITEPLETSLNEEKETAGDAESELMIEVRREVQELLHGKKIPKEDEEKRDYPDFNRKYAVKNKTNKSVEDTDANAQGEEAQSRVEPAFKNKGENDEGIVLKDLKFDCSGRFAILHGRVINHLSVPIRYIKAEIELYDDFHNVIKIMKWYLCGREYLQPGETRDFTYTAYEIYGVYDYHIRILSCKRT